MSSLTIESMDRMNFLITDVTLECLGNKFFDVYGTQVDSLFRLISSNTLKVKPTDVDQESDLCQSLTAVDAPKRIKVKNLHRQAIAAAAAAQAQAEAAAKLPKTKQPKRRASFSMVNNEADTANDPESLLMPMAPKAAKIANRRSTISVQLAKARTKKPIVIADDLEKVQIKTRKHTSDGAQSNVKPIADIRKTLIQNIDARYNALCLLSESQEEKYRTLNINANIDDFFNAEARSLHTQSNTLVEFIKFIEEDRDNVTKLANVTHAMIDLQSDYQNHYG